MSVKSVEQQVQEMQSIAAPEEKKRSGNTRPRPPVIALDQPGRLRISHLLSLLSISAPTFYRHLNKGRIPPATGNDGRPYWKTETIKAFLDEKSGGA